MFVGAYHSESVLVTGHTGFKGGWLCQWLLGLGAKVTGLALPPDSKPQLFKALGLEGRLEHHIVDMRDADKVLAIIQAAKPKFVFHLAAQPLVRDSYSQPKATFDINVGGTVNVLEAIRATPSVRSCVVVTSDKCYDNREWLRGYRETDNLGGHDPYSASKAATEIVVDSWRKSFFSDGRVRLASVRAGNVIGGGDWSHNRLVPDFIRAINAGQPLVLRNPQATRPWQHVLEPLSAYLHLGARLASEDGQRFAEAWNIGPDNESVISVERLAHLLVESSRCGTIVIEPQSTHLHEAGLLRLDCTKIADRLGWKGTWTLENAIVRTVEWYKAHDRAFDCATLCNQQIADYTANATAVGQCWTE